MRRLMLILLLILAAPATAQTVTPTQYREDAESIEALIQGRANRRMDPFLLQVPAGGGRSVSRPHEGEEFLIVLEGRVTLEYGTGSFALETGDSLYFDAETPHRLLNPHAQAARVLCVFLEK